MLQSLRNFNEEYVGPTLVGTLTIGISLAMGWLVVGEPLQKWHQTKDWVESPANIIETELLEYQDSDGTTYQTTALYSYTFAGGNYQGTQVSLYSGGDNVGGFHQQIYRELSQYQESGETFRCYVNPDNPYEVILYRNIRWGKSIFVGLIVIIVSGAGVLLIVNTVKKAFTSHKEYDWSKKNGAGLPRSKQNSDEAYASMLGTMMEALQDTKEARKSKPSSSTKQVKDDDYYAENLSMFFGKLTEKMMETTQEANEARDRKPPNSARPADNQKDVKRD